MRARTNTPYARTAAQRLGIARRVAEVESLVLRTATLELDATLPVATLADRLRRCLAIPDPTARVGPRPLVRVGGPRP
ncbi:hypothetical protein GCM10023226_05800 [Nocardioides nanhaiensis]|uniref:DUF222 domain-containing protein n=1 Tax=Nocardioides nanhaiensis TaxID=1476871 RepID=A0ABP8VU97_9ACTN